MNLSENKPVVMIIDDEPENLNALAGLLESDGWDICAFPEADSALAAAAEFPPDLVLLDICMPGKDGFEACRILKDSPQTREIPVLFLSALSDPDSKIKAFEAGGVDYLTKPFHAEEVLVRVRTHLELRRHRTDLARLISDRSQELSQAHRRLQLWDQTKDQWLNMIAREIRAPLTGLAAASDLLFVAAQETPETQEVRAEYNSSLERINSLLNDALLLTRFNVAALDFAARPADCIPLLDQAIRAAAKKNPGIRIRADLGTEPRCAAVDTEMIQQAFSDLLLTATRFARDGESIFIETGADEQNLHIAVLTTGRKLPERMEDSFFESATQQILFKDEIDSRPGPALARRIIELFSGTCSVRNGDPDGIVIEIKIPLC